jgi:hypothetical protein
MTEDAVVNDMVDSGVQYAVIAGLRTETGPERLVVSYPNEELLRDLIAAPSIIAVGFSSREQAVAGGRVCVPTAATYQPIPEAMAGGRSETPQQGLGRAEQRGDAHSVLRRLGRFLVTAHSNVLTAAIVMFSSRNTFSAAIRIAMGSSV